MDLSLSQCTPHRLPSRSAASLLSSSKASFPIPTGLPSLDAAVQAHYGKRLLSHVPNALPGLPRGKIVRISGSSGVGKTAFCAQLTRTVLSSGGSVLWIDCATPVFGPLLYPLSDNTPPSASTADTSPPDDVSKRLRRARAPSLAHLLALFLHSPPSLFAHSLVVLDGLSPEPPAERDRNSDRRDRPDNNNNSNNNSNNNNNSSSRSSNNSSNTSRAPPSQAQDPVAAALSALAKLASIHSFVAAVACQAVTRVRNDGPAFLVPAIEGASVRDPAFAASVELVLFRDWLATPGGAAPDGTRADRFVALLRDGGVVVCVPFVIGDKLREVTLLAPATAREEEGDATASAAALAASAAEDGQAPANEPGQWEASDLGPSSTHAGLDPEIEHALEAELEVELGLLEEQQEHEFDPVEIVPDGPVLPLHSRPTPTAAAVTSTTPADPNHDRHTTASPGAKLGSLVAAQPAPSEEPPEHGPAPPALFPSDNKPGPASTGSRPEPSEQHRHQQHQLPGLLPSSIPVSIPDSDSDQDPFDPDGAAGSDAGAANLLLFDDFPTPSTSGPAAAQAAAAAVPASAAAASARCAAGEPASESDPDPLSPVPSSSLSSLLSEPGEERPEPGSGGPRSSSLSELLSELSSSSTSSGDEGQDGGAAAVPVRSSRRAKRTASTVVENSQRSRRRG